MTRNYFFIDSLSSRDFYFLLYRTCKKSGIDYSAVSEPSDLVESDSSRSWDPRESDSALSGTTQKLVLLFP